MRLERIGNGFQVDAAFLGPLLGVPARDVQQLMREGRITSLCEKGQGSDSGRYRLTFRHGTTRLRLTVSDQGEVLTRTRTTGPDNPPLDPLSRQGQIGTRRT